MTLVFWISASLLVYILVAWPVGLGLLARPVTRQFVPRTVSVIIAAVEPRSLWIVTGAKKDDSVPSASPE
jgi:hypothetical protein